MTRIGFILFPRLTQLDLTGPWEVLTRLSHVECHLISKDMSPVQSDGGGLILTPTLTFDDCPQLDVLCIPGGPGHLWAMQDPAVLRFLRQQAAQAQYVSAVCTGSMILAAAGLLRGYRATTHWMSLGRLEAFGATPIHERVVADRNRITGGGVTAGIDLGLTLSRLLRSEDEEAMIRLQMEYAPTQSPGGRPETADAAVVAALLDRAEPYVRAIANVDAEAVSRLTRQ